MSNKHKNWTRLLGAATFSVLGLLGCDFPIWQTCTPNSEHKAQSGCTCPCNNNTEATECKDTNNACCYEPGGKCRTSTNTTPAADSGAAVALAPTNKDGIRASMLRCFNESGACQSAYPLLPCQAFYERVTFGNFADAPRQAPQGTEVPQLVIAPPFDLSYAFVYPPKSVAWDSLNAGQTQEVANEIKTIGSAGQEAAGLDPGATQCKASARFTIQLLGVPEWSLLSSGVYDGPLVEGSPSQPFGSCSAGPGC